ncbi:MAG: phosphopantothenoylcysteine decarboxylase [Planctomycetota bacterium]
MTIHSPKNLDGPNAPSVPGAPRPRLLITAGPTREPIDAVRYLGNRSSGRLGVGLADAAAARGWDVLLLLGPTRVSPTDERVRVIRFETTAELGAALAENQAWCERLVMAAAVSDYRPVADEIDTSAKRTRSGEGMKLRLEATPDLLAGCAARRTGGQTLVGFALEPAERLVDSATRKLERKGVDLIVANPLETMDSGEIEATLIGWVDESPAVVDRTPGRIAKEAFADWLLDRISARRAGEVRHAQA